MLREYLDKFVIAYLDNIIIYFNIKEKYKKTCWVGIKRVIWGEYTSYSRKIWVLH